MNRRIMCAAFTAFALTFAFVSEVSAGDRARSFTLFAEANSGSAAAGDRTRTTVNGGTIGESRIGIPNAEAEGIFFTRYSAEGQKEARVNKKGQFRSGDTESIGSTAGVMQLGVDQRKNEASYFGNSAQTVSVVGRNAQAELGSALSGRAGLENGKGRVESFSDASHEAQTTRKRAASVAGASFMDGRVGRGR